MRKFEILTGSFRDIFRRLLFRPANVSLVRSSERVAQRVPSPAPHPRIRQKISFFYTSPPSIAALGIYAIWIIWIIQTQMKTPPHKESNPTSAYSIRLISSFSVSVSGLESQVQDSKDLYWF